MPERAQQCKHGVAPANAAHADSGAVGGWGGLRDPPRELLEHLAVSGGQRRAVAQGDEASLDRSGDLPGPAERVANYLVQRAARLAGQQPASVRLILFCFAFIRHGYLRRLNLAFKSETLVIVAGISGSEIAASGEAMT
jgi:hypothetical protein